MPISLGSNMIKMMFLMGAVTSVGRDQTGGREMSQEAPRIVWNGDKGSGEEKMNWNHFPFPLSSGWQVRVATILFFISLFTPKVK